MSPWLGKVLQSWFLRLVAVGAGVGLIAYAAIFAGSGDARSDAALAAASRLANGDEQPVDLPASRVGYSTGAGNGMAKPAALWLGENREVSMQLRFAAENYERGALPRDYADLITALRHRAEGGDSGAQFLLGHAYGDGMGVPKDTQLMAVWYARAEDVAARSAVRVPANYTEALESIRQAAEGGDTVAQLYVGMAYDAGRGVERNRVQAATWYRKAAEQGSASAACNLGVLAYEGRGAKGDNAETVRWLERAAAGGSVMAQFSLGRLYATGDGVEKDTALAVRWLEKAADRDYAPAQMLLSAMSATGDGISGSNARAYMWIDLAAMRDGRARSTADEVARLISPEDLMQGNRLMEDWLARHPRGE